MTTTLIIIAFLLLASGVVIGFAIAEEIEIRKQDRLFWEEYRKEWTKSGKPS